MIDFTLFFESLPLLLKGAGVSLQIAGLALIIGFLGGTLLGIVQASHLPFLKFFANAYVTIVRGTPMLIQIVFLYYVLSSTGLGLSAFMSAVIAIGCNSAAYVSEIIRSGIASVSYGQIEAAQTLGIRRRDIMAHIILPQAVRTVLPALGNEAINLIKDSSLASLIGVMELYKEGLTIISTTYDALTIYSAIACIYLVLTTSLAYGVSCLEYSLNKRSSSC